MIGQKDRLLYPNTGRAFSIDGWLVGWFTFIFDSIWYNENT
jgi:hypothetical protein